MLLDDGLPCRLMDTLGEWGRLLSLDTARGSDEEMRLRLLFSSFAIFLSFLRMICIPETIPVSAGWGVRCARRLRTEPCSGRGAVANFSHGRSRGWGGIPLSW